MKEKRQKQKEKSKIVFEKLMQKEERLQNIRKAKEKERKKKVSFHILYHILQE